jgi:hypothetical protein
LVVFDEAFDFPVKEVFELDIVKGMPLRPALRPALMGRFFLSTDLGWSVRGEDVKPVDSCVEVFRARARTDASDVARELDSLLGSEVVRDLGASEIARELESLLGSDVTPRFALRVAG